MGAKTQFNFNLSYPWSASLWSLKVLHKSIQILASLSLLIFITTAYHPIRRTWCLMKEVSSHKTECHVVLKARFYSSLILFPSHLFFSLWCRWCCVILFPVRLMDVLSFKSTQRTRRSKRTPSAVLHKKRWSSVLLLHHPWFTTTVLRIPDSGTGSSFLLLWFIIFPVLFFLDSCRVRFIQCLPLGVSTLAVR